MASVLHQYHRYWIVTRIGSSSQLSHFIKTGNIVKQRSSGIYLIDVSDLAIMHGVKFLTQPRTLPTPIESMEGFEPGNCRTPLP